jgi:hypothetical protein
MLLVILIISLSDLIKPQERLQLSIASTVTAKIPGATWIWDASQVSGPSADQVVYFLNRFYIPGVPVKALLEVATDNYFTVSINGKDTGCSTSSGTTYANAINCDVTSTLNSGLNKINFSVTNAGSWGSNYQTNPAGLLYKLSIQVLVV